MGGIELLYLSVMVYGRLILSSWKEVGSAEANQLMLGSGGVCRDG